MPKSHQFSNSRRVRDFFRFTYIPPAPQPQTVGISGWMATFMSRGCNCQNRQTQKAYLGRTMELTQQFVITDMDDVNQKKVYKCFVVVLIA